MATTTPNYGLTLFEPDDKPTWQGDWNETMTKLDTTIKEIADGSGGGGGSVEIAQTTGQSTTAVMSQKAVTDSLAGKANTEDIPAAVTVVQETGDSTTSVMSQDAVTKALAGSGGMKYAQQTADITLTEEGQFPEVTGCELTLESGKYLIQGSADFYQNITQSYGHTVGVTILNQSSNDTSTAISNNVNRAGGLTEAIVTLNSQTTIKLGATIKTTTAASYPISVEVSGGIITAIKL